MKDLGELATKAYETIFNNKKSVEINGKIYRVRRTSSRGLRFLIIEGYTFLEQNPEKNSVWGNLAKDGHKILWIIEDGDYIGQVRDGVYHDLHKEN